MNKSAVNESTIREVGLKVTLPRTKILSILENAEKSQERHLSAEHIYQTLREQGESISLATVYRVLTQFELAGLIERQQFEGGHSVFELNAGEHHDHMVCTQCGGVTEFFDQAIEQQQEAIAKQKGFRITHHSMILYGVCKACS